MLLDKISQCIPKFSFIDNEYKVFGQLTILDKKFDNLATLGCIYRILFDVRIWKNWYKGIISNEGIYPNYVGGTTLTILISVSTLRITLLE